MDLDDLVTVVLDEIALEGLDGITLETLWDRLNARPNFPNFVSYLSFGKSTIWEIVKVLNDVDFYELPSPRPPFKIFNRYDYVDPELGMVLEPTEIPEEIYQHCAIDDKENGIIGSCPTYDKRKIITDEVRKMSLEAVVEQWGQKLVIVGNQIVRNTALMGSDYDPTLEIKPMPYCVLERIGRSRYHGEVTHGKVSLQAVGEDPKSLFYHRKFLAKHGLIVKQVHHQKSGNQNCNGSLLHLPRFYVERKPKALFLTERVVEILKTRENFLAEYEEIRKELGLQNSLKKLFKTFDFQRYVKTDLKIPYRTLYPDAKVSEWKHKGNDKEKALRCVQLVNPDMDIQDIWSKYEEDENEDDDSSSESENDNDHYLDQSFLPQVLEYIDKQGGPEGFSQVELSKKMGMSKLQTRTVCRNLVRRGLVSIFMRDVGRQRVSRYVSKRLDKSCAMNMLFTKEKEKMLSLMSSKTTEIKEKKKKGKRLSVDDPSEIQDRKKLKLGSHDDTKQGSTELNNFSCGKDQKKLEINDLSKLNVDQSIETEIIEVTDNIPGIKNNSAGFSDDLCNPNPTRKDAPNVTYRLMKRANIILEAVRTHRVIDDFTKLLKLIAEEEEKEGYNVKIDKRSLLRLLLKLSNDRQLKMIKVVLKSDTKEKVLSFACEASITADHTVIQSAIDQAKIKFFLMNKEKLSKLTHEEENMDCSAAKSEQLDQEGFNSESVHQSVDEMKALQKDTKDKKLTLKYDKRIGKKYGFCPKFLRMKILHQFLFYLIYSYDGDDSLDQTEALKAFEHDGIEIDEELPSEISKIYHKTLSWKTFIPPLPRHVGWPNGWALMCDLLLRIPLSIFISIVNVSYVIPELPDYLNHPVKKHFLVKHLPCSIRYSMMAARKYIFSFHEVVQRLCYIGLVQFGPQRLKEKDQVFIYLNRKTSVLDTKPSRPGYHQISDDIEYVRKYYDFKTFPDVEKYWYEVWDICIHTKLGGRMCVAGKDIILSVLQNKPAMIEALQPSTPESATTLDNGAVPGDQKGAAGFDSAIFSHLKRNWNWTMNYQAQNPENLPTDDPRKKEELRKLRLSSLKRCRVVFSEELGIPSKTSKCMPWERSVVRKVSRNKRKSVTKPSKKRKTAIQNIVRRVLPVKKRVRLRPFYDKIDIQALQLMSKLRVDWSTNEDNILLLCKVANTYLCPNPRQQVISFHVIRDVLHELSPSAKNKTSRACQRRILYMMKNLSTSNSVALRLEELRFDQFVIKEFGNVASELKQKAGSPEEFGKLISEKFVQLVKYLSSKAQKDIQDDKDQTSTIPNSLKEFLEKYELVYPSKSIKKKGTFADVSSIQDIHECVVNAVIHSSLCSTSDKTSWAYQLFKVYQQYPDSLLRSVMSKIRADQMVSLKKDYTRLQKTGNYLPLSSLPFQLSISYEYTIQTKYQYSIFQQASSMVANLKNWCQSEVGKTCGSGMEVLSIDGGSTAALVELYCQGLITFNLDIPEQVIILDPRVSETDETYVRIIERYRDILKTYRVEKNTSSSLFLNSVNDGSSFSEKGNPREAGADEEDDGVDEVEFDVPEDSNTMPPAFQQNILVNAASRIALYMSREDIEDPSIGNSQHAHDFIVVNSCKIFTKLCDDQLENNENSHYLPIGKERKDFISKIENSIKESIVIKDKNVNEIDVCVKFISNGATKDEWVLAKKVIQYVKSKKEKGVTICALKQKLSCKSGLMTFPQILSLLLETGILRRCGVTVARVVHCKFYRPWLLLTYKLKRMLKDNIKPIEPKSVYYSNEPENVTDVGSSSKQIHTASETTNTTDIKNITGQSMEECENVQEVICIDISKEAQEDDSSKKLPEVKTISPTGESQSTSGFDEATEDLHLPDQKTDETVELPNKNKMQLGNTDPIQCLQSDNSSDKSEAVDSTKGVRHSKREHKPTVKLDSSDSRYVEPFYQKTRRKLMGAAELNDATQSLDMGDSILITIRPWVRVNGTLNKRVLDRLLGAVLGHVMLQPGLSVKSLGDRFSPALQPYHVRELVEILEKLNCLNLYVIAKSHRATLWSTPAEITVSVSDGTESEEEIMVKPLPDAVLKLSQFLENKCYSKPFLTTD